MLAFSSCRESDQLAGKWMQPVPGMLQEQGFVLEENGEAFSVNMATLQYEKWENTGNRLILSGKSIGNRQVIAFTDSFDIEKLTEDSLILRKGDLLQKFARQTDAGQPNAPKTVEGILTIGHEVRALTVEGDTCNYWIVDKTDKLAQQYDSITNGVKNGQPIYAKLQVVDMGHSDEGFAADYDKVLHIVGIDSLAPYDFSLRLLREAIRTEATDGSKKALYVLFSRDSLFADLHTSGTSTVETLDRHSLSSGRHVWNMEDDDTKNLQCEGGRWTVSRRGKNLFEQARSDNDTALGGWKESHYAGMLPAADCEGIKYDLYIRHREHSGDGRFLLQLTYVNAENGKDKTFTHLGKRYTLRGTPTDSNATVWQLVSDEDKATFNFLYNAKKNALTLLGDDFSMADSELNYTLEMVH